MNLFIPKHECLKILPSPIQGLGVFATDDIPLGRKLSYFTGEEITHKDFKRKYGKDMRYVYRRMPWQTLIVAKDNRNLITFVNDGHHLQAHPDHNCILKRRWLIPIHNIKKGEELTLHYPDNYFKMSPHPK